MHITSAMIHPAFNALLNGTCAVLLLLGRRAISRGDVATHRKRMVGAFTVASIFLASYLIRFATTGAHMYPGHSIDRILYLIMLFSHMALAVVLVPLVLRALQLALKGRFIEHKRMVAWTWPIWMYVSVTGVLVFVMLYLVGPALHS
jgi:uncharacterized membrane protein YozB (DUF420 family)